MKKWILWPVLNVGFCAALWFGFWQDVEGARHIVQFWVWAVILPLAWLYLVWNKSPDQRGIFRRAVSWGVRSFTVITLVWAAYFFTALAYIVAVVFLAVSNNAAAKDLGVSQQEAP